MRIMNKTLTIMMFVALTFGIFIGISQMTAQPSYASGANCGGISSCKTTVSTDFGRQGGGNSLGTKPSPNPPPGSKPIKTKPSPPERVCSPSVYYDIPDGGALPGITGGWSNYNGGCLNKYKTVPTFSKLGIASCPVSTAYGIERKAKGVVYLDIYQLRIAQKTSKDGALETGKTSMFYGYEYINQTKTCVYPEAKLVASNKYCALSVNAKLDRLANSRLGAGRIKSFNETFATINGLKKGTDKCQKSVTMNFTAGMSSNEKTWGQYSASGNIKFARCTEYKVTFDGKTDTQWGACKPGSSGAVPSHFTLWCGGAEPRLVPGKSWTMNDCYKLPKSGYTCNVPDPMYDGKKGTVQTLRDGKSRVLNWGAPKTGSSVRNTKNWEQAVTINKGSSPRLTSVGDNNKSKQMFWSNVSFGTKWIKSSNKQNVAFYNASNPNASWSATRKLRFDGQFKTYVGEPTSYNPWTGKMNLKKRLVWVNDYNISCETAISPKIQALRSVGDAQ